MYIDWVIALSVIIIFLTCVFLAWGLYFALRKINQETSSGDPTRNLRH